MEKFDEKLKLEVNIAKLTEILKCPQDIIQGSIDIPLKDDSLQIDFTNQLAEMVKPIIKTKILELEYELLNLRVCTM